MKKIALIIFKAILALGLVILLDLPIQSQSEQKANQAGFDESLYNSIQWRGIGPYRGGRSAAVTGVPGKSNLYYMGATGGGLWRTKDGGSTWENISDGILEVLLVQSPWPNRTIM